MSMTTKLGMSDIGMSSMILCAVKETDSAYLSITPSCGTGKDWGLGEFLTVLLHCRSKGGEYHDLAVSEFSLTLSRYCNLMNSSP